MNKKVAVAPWTLAAITAITAMTPTAHAQWTVVSLHPAGALYSRANGMFNGPYQAGTSYFSADGAEHAAKWTLTSASWVDLNPAGAASSSVFASFGNLQGGSANVGGVLKASIWNGTAASWTSLHPAGVSSSEVLGIFAPVQVGWTMTAGVQHAAKWTGSAGSRVDLNPAGATRSVAYGAFTGNQQAGSATIGGVMQAGIWTGTAASWVSLHPAGASFSQAAGISKNAGGVYQFGAAQFADESHAGVWRSTAASWYDVHPPGATSSFINAANGSFLVGEVDGHATLWSGSDMDGFFVEDLHDSVPINFTASTATGYYFNGSSFFISGYGFNSETNQNEALLWGQEVPAPGAGVLLSLGGVMVSRRRR